MDNVFFARLESLCSQNSVKDVSGLLKALDLSTSKGTAWRNGAIPKGDILLKIASYFHVSTDYLLGNTDDPAPVGQKESPPQGGEPLHTIQDWEKALDGLDQEQLKQVMDLVMKKFMEGGK